MLYLVNESKLSDNLINNLTSEDKLFIGCKSDTLPVNLVKKVLNLNSRVELIRSDSIPTLEKFLTENDMEYKSYIEKKSEVKKESEKPEKTKEPKEEVVTEKPKRHRRTKAEMEAARRLEVEKSNTSETNEIVADVEANETEETETKPVTKEEPESFDMPKPIESAESIETLQPKKKRGRKTKEEMLKLKEQEAEALKNRSLEDVQMEMINKFCDTSKNKIIQKLDSYDREELRKAIIKSFDYYVNFRLVLATKIDNKYVERIYPDLKPIYDQIKETVAK